MCIKRQRCSLTPNPLSRQNTRLHQCLKSIADTDDGFARFDEDRDFICKIGFEVKGEEFARAQSISVGKASRKDEQLKVREKCFIHPQFIKREDRKSTRLNS